MENIVLRDHHTFTLWTSPTHYTLEPTPQTNLLIANPFSRDKSYYNNQGTEHRVEIYPFPQTELFFLFFFHTDLLLFIPAITSLF